MKTKHGGFRKGSGAKLKYGEPTTPVVIRVPKSRVKEFRTFVGVELKKWQHELH
jgi:hypothetical protein